MSWREVLDSLQAQAHRTWVAQDFVNEIAMHYQIIPADAASLGIDYWTTTLGCSQDELAAAAARVGNSADEVRREPGRAGDWRHPERHMRLRKRIAETSK
jgi:hypothetical protein